MGIFPLDFKKGENEMNKRELIEHINNALFDTLKDTLYIEPTFSITENAKDNKVAITFETKQGGALVGGMLKKFEKVTIPQFVADWYEDHKDSFDYNLWEYLTDWEEQEPSEFKEWFNKSNKAFQTLVNMHQFGYEVEKEKRYLVKLKGINSESEYLYYGNGSCTWRFREKNESGYFRKNHTRKELKDAGFGEVFNSQLFEVKEVEE